MPKFNRGVIFHHRGSFSLAQSSVLSQPSDRVEDGGAGGAGHHQAGRDHNLLLLLLLLLFLFLLLLLFVLFLNKFFLDLQCNFGLGLLGWMGI